MSFRRSPGEKQCPSGSQTSRAAEAMLRAWMRSHGVCCNLTLSSTNREMQMRANLWKYGPYALSGIVVIVLIISITSISRATIKTLDLTNKDQLKKVHRSLDRRAHWLPQSYFRPSSLDSRGLAGSSWRRSLAGCMRQRCRARSPVLLNGSAEAHSDDRYSGRYPVKCPQLRCDVAQTRYTIAASPKILRIHRCSKDARKNVLDSDKYVEDNDFR